MAELQDSASVNVSNALAVLEFLFLFFWCSGFGVKVAEEEASKKRWLKRNQATIRQMPQAALIVA